MRIVVLVLSVLLASSASAQNFSDSFAAGFLAIDCTSDNISGEGCTVSISCDSNTNTLKINSAEPQSGEVSCSEITRIDINGSTNPDNIDLSSVTKSSFPNLTSTAISGDRASDVIKGSQLRDDIDGGDDVDTIYGNAGNDTIDADSGNDEVHCGLGNDIINGGSGNDTLFGDAGVDTIEGQSGNDKLYGGSGNDKLFGGSGSDLLDGGSGRDSGSQGSGKGRSISIEK